MTRYVALALLTLTSCKSGVAECMDGFAEAWEAAGCEAVDPQADESAESVCGDWDELGDDPRAVGESFGESSCIGWSAEGKGC